MDELLKAVLMERMTDRNKEISEAPATISFEKEHGMDATTKIKMEGHVSVLLFGCECLVSVTVKKANENKMAQALILKLMYENIKRDLELK